MRLGLAIAESSLYSLNIETGKTRLQIR